MEMLLTVAVITAMEIAVSISDVGMHYDRIECFPAMK
jgi:hypothetical protein